MNIFKTLSGILKKYPDNNNENAAMVDFHTSPNDNLIVYVGGSDKKSRACEYVIDAVLKLSDIVDNLKCVIISPEKNIEDKVKKVNDSLGKNIIFAFGDISQDIISQGKLFVGDGDAIKAAMLQEKPVIIAGDSGYIGIFDESKKEKCIETDFCCKNETKTDSGLLAQDIGGFFGLWEDEQEKLGKYARQVMVEYNK